jgi:putative NADH-flavin reductase
MQLTHRANPGLNTILIMALICMLSACSPGNQEGIKAGAAAPQLTDTPPALLNILVIGGSAGIGLETVKLALARGHTVTMMSRAPDKAGLEHPSLTLFPGSILDASATNTAVQGQDAVVISIGMGPTREPVSLFSEGARNVLAGMTANGVARLLTVTGIGVAETRGHGSFFYDNILQPLALNTIYEDKEKQEVMVRASQLQWTLLRPGFLTDDEPTGSYRVITDITGVTVGDISRADTAHYIIAALEQQLHIEEAPILSE